MSKKQTLESAFGSPDRPLKIGDFEIQCYVLNDGQRVLVQKGLTKALGMSTGGGTGGAQRIVQFANSKGMIPFIDEGLRARIENPIKFQTNNTLAYGYEATILVDICDAVMSAKKAGTLQKQQLHIAENAEMLIRAFAKTGIIALVDEATGFQEVREKDALKKFLEKFIQDEMGKWVKTFQDDFFEMIFKMKGWTWHYASTKKPQVIGHYINDFVYSRLGPQVLKELKERNKTESGGKKGKNHQFLTQDMGHPALRERLAILTAFGRATGYNWNNWKRMVERTFPKFGDTIQLDIPDLDDE